MCPAELIEEHRPLRTRDDAMHDTASARLAGRLRRGGTQQLANFLVCRLPEVVVPLTDGRKIFWRTGTDDVGDRRELATGIRRAHRHRDDEVSGSQCPHCFDGGLHRRSGGQTVVDQHDRASAYIEWRTSLAIRALPDRKSVV